MSFFTLATSIGGYFGRRHIAKRQAMWDRYNNAMAGIQAGQAQNAITDNVALNRAKHAENKVALETSRLQAAAKVKAGAAAAGVAGGSVASTIFDIGRNAGRKLAAENDRFETSLLVTDQQRRNVAMQRTMAKKPITQTPSFMSAVATAGLRILEDNINTPQSSGTTLEGEGTQQETGGWDRLREMLMI